MSDVGQSLYLEGKGPGSAGQRIGGTSMTPPVPATATIVQHPPRLCIRLCNASELDRRSCAEPRAGDRQAVHVGCDSHAYHPPPGRKSHPPLARQLAQPGPPLNPRRVAARTTTKRRGGDGGVSGRVRTWPEGARGRQGGLPCRLLTSRPRTLTCRMWSQRPPCPPLPPLLQPASTATSSWANARLARVPTARCSR